MRFMMIVKANATSEAGVMPTEEMLIAMGKYNEELVKSGVLLAADGLHPSSRGVRVQFGDGKRTVIDGPFAETNELVAGYWIIQAKSQEEAIEWAKRVPFDANAAGPYGGGEIEIRQVFESTDFVIETPEGKALLQAEQDFRKRANA